MESIINNNKYFPHCIIFWMEGKTKPELEQIRDEEFGKRYLSRYNYDYDG